MVQYFVCISTQTQIGGRFSSFSKTDKQSLGVRKFDLNQALGENGFVSSNVCLEDQLQQLHQHEFYMRKAINLAKQGAQVGQVPVGAVLVLNGEIISEGFNEIETIPDPTAHAEMTCIRRAANKLGRWRLLNSTLYVTLEPCPMCAGAILQARIPNLVYGAKNPLLGADGSWIDMFQESVDQNDVGPLRPHPFHPQIKVQSGILAQECSQLLKNFFRERRENCCDKHICNGELINQIDV